MTGLYAYLDSNNPRKFWLGVNYGDDLWVQELNPFTGIEGTLFKHSSVISGVLRFYLSKDRIFYTTDGSNVSSLIYNPSAGDQASVSDIAGRDSIRDPAQTVQGFGNQPLYDFREWASFLYGPSIGSPERFKLVWSVQTGYFLLNANDRIVAHLYGNFTPYNVSTPSRVSFLGEAKQIGTKVFVPVLRSGQQEVVNREAVSDRILPGGRSNLTSFRPLGLELIEFDMDSNNPPEVAQVGNQLMISGSVLSYSEGQSLTEFAFSERPRIEKTPAIDYDRWAYSDLDVNLPRLGELSRAQFNELDLTTEGRKAPYLVESARFTATTATTKTGVGTGLASWDSGSTNVKRTLRYSTKASDGTIDDSYQGVLAEVYYDTADSALVVKYTGAPATLSSGKDHPQGILLNGVRYDFHKWEVASGTLTAYHYTDTPVIVENSTYTVISPSSDVIVQTGDSQTVQIANTDNRNTQIKEEGVRLRNYAQRSVSLNTTAPNLSLIHI